MDLNRNDWRKRCIASVGNGIDLLLLRIERVGEGMDRRQEWARNSSELVPKYPSIRLKQHLTYIPMPKGRYRGNRRSPVF